MVLFAFAAYAGGSVLLGVVNFRECPDAAAELRLQMRNAKEVMAHKGVK